MILSGIPRRLSSITRVGAAALAAASTLAGSCGPALAGDWSIEARYSAKAEFDDNYELLTDPDGYVLAGTANIYSDFIYTTARSRFDLIADLVGRGYVGPGSDGLTDNVFPRIESKYHQSGKRTDLDLGAYYALEYIPALDEPDSLDLEDSSSDAIRSSFGANAGVSHRVDRRNTVNLRAAASRSVYEGGEGTDNLNINGSLGWTRRMTKRTDGTARISATYLDLEDEENTERLTTAASVSLSSRFSNRLSASIGGGVNVVNSNKDDLLTGGREQTVTTGFTFDAGLDYKLKTVTVAVKINHGIEPSSLGDLENSTNISLAIDKSLTERSSLSFIARASRSEDIDDEGGNDLTYSLSLGPSYSLRLTDEWNLAAGYNFALEDSSDGTATSNNVFVSLTRNFVAMP